MFLSVTSLIPPELLSLVRANLYPSRSPSSTLFDLPPSHTLDVLLYSPPRPTTPIKLPPFPPILKPIPRRPHVSHLSVSEALHAALNTAVGSQTPSVRSRVPTPARFLKMDSDLEEKEPPNTGRISRPNMFRFQSTPPLNFLDVAPVDSFRSHL